MKLLLERVGIDPNSLDENGRTPLSFAAEKENNVAVRPLLERKDLDLDSTDSNDQTPLSFTATEGHEGAVKLLPEQRDVDPNSSVNNGRTPLPFATKEGQDDVVRLLQERGGIGIPTSALSENTPIESFTLYIVDCLLLDPSTLGPVLSGSPLGQPLPPEQSPPDHLHQPLTPHPPLPLLSVLIPPFLFSSGPLSCSFSYLSRSRYTIGMGILLN